MTFPATLVTRSHTNTRIEVAPDRPDGMAQHDWTAVYGAILIALVVGVASLLLERR